MNRYVFTQLKKEQNDTLLCVSGVRKRGKGGGGGEWRPKVGGP
jgi:hypothetical protein